MSSLSKILENYGMDMAGEAVRQIKHHKKDTQYQQLRDEAHAEILKLVPSEEKLMDILDNSFGCWACIRRKVFAKVLHALFLKKLGGKNT